MHNLLFKNNKARKLGSTLAIIATQQTRLLLYMGIERRHMHVFAVGKWASLGGRTTIVGRDVKPASVAGRPCIIYRWR